MVLTLLLPLLLSSLEELCWLLKLADTLGQLLLLALTLRALPEGLSLMEPLREELPLAALPLALRALELLPLGLA